MGIPGSGLVKPVVKPLQKGASFATRPLKPVVKPLKPLVKPLVKDKPKPVGAIPIFDHNHKSLLGGTRANSDPRIHVPQDDFFKKYAAEEEVVEEEIIEEEVIEEEIIEEEYFEEEDPVMSTPPPNKHLSQRQTTIKFDEFDDMFDVLHLNDYSKTEIAKTWYERSDFSKMVEESRKVVTKWEEDMKKGKDKDKDEDKDKKISVLKNLKNDPRGLENWTTMGATKVKLIKETAMDAVWNEQMRQWNRHRMNPDQIRIEYQRTTKGSETTARKLADADREFVDSMLEEEEARREYERNMKKRQKILRQGKRIVGGTVKGSTKLTGTVLKKTGKGVITTGKITGKSSLAIATLDRKALMKAIKNKKDEKGCVEGVHHRRVSLSSRNLLASIEGLDDEEDTPLRKGTSPEPAPAPTSPGGRPSLLNPYSPTSSKSNTGSPTRHAAVASSSTTPEKNGSTTGKITHHQSSSRNNKSSESHRIKPIAQTPQQGPSVRKPMGPITPTKNRKDEDDRSVDSALSGVSGTSGTSGDVKQSTGSSSGASQSKRQRWKERRKEKRQRRKDKKREKKDKKKVKKDQKKLEKKEKHSHRPEWEAPNLVKSGKY